MVEPIQSSTAYAGNRPGASEPRFPEKGSEGTAEQSHLRAGFGQGTVTAPAAALQALDRGVRAAAETAPSLDELQAAQRAERADERRALQTEDVAPPPKAGEAQGASAAEDPIAARSTADGPQRPEASRAVQSSAPDQPAAPPEAVSEPRQEPPVPPTEPTGPNALSGQRLNVLA